MKRKDLRFLNFLVLRGPNLWTYRPVIEAWVDIGELEDCPSNTLPGFVERLCAWLPTLAEHRCSYGEPGGFIRRLHEGTWPAHILEHVTLELQNLAGMPGGFGKARETPLRGVYKVVVSAYQEDVTRACLEAARDLVMAAIEDTRFGLDATLARLTALVKQHLLGPNTACIVDASSNHHRGIPSIRLSADNLVQLGYGCRQRRIWAAETDRTGAIAEGIARNPSLTRRLLESCCLPVTHPDDDTVRPDAKSFRLLVVGGQLVAAARLDATTPLDVTDEVHPETAAAAILAARVVGLDIAGIDLLASDLSCPLAAQDGAIVAVHAGPGLVPHLLTAAGAPRPVGRAIVDHLFPNGDTGRIPVVGITGTHGTNEVAHLVAEFLRLSGKATGLACSDGLYCNRHKVDTGDCANWQSGRRVLMNRAIEAAVIENSAEVILGQGLAYDRCQIGIITRIDPACDLGRYHIVKPEQVFQVFRTQVDVVLAGGVAVLPAADPDAAALAALCDGEVIFFALDPALPLLADHRARGGRAVILRDNQLVLAAADAETQLLPLTAIPFLTDSPSDAQLECVLAAVSAAWALDIALHVIRTGTETFCHDRGRSMYPETPDPAAVAKSLLTNA